MKISKYLIPAVLMLFILTACRKDNNVKANQKISNFSQFFDVFWNGINANYVYWDIDTTKWDKTYTNFKPLFDNLDINKQADVNKSISYLKQITSGFIDGHFQIIGNPGIFSNINIYPIATRKKNALSYHPPYDYNKIDLAYFDSYETDVDSSLHVTVGKIEKNITYFSCNQFSLLSAYNTSNVFHTLLDTFFKSMLTDNIQNKGVIIDVRNNFGGDLADLNFLIGHVINKPLDIGYSSYKSNTGRLDYTPWIKATINPLSSQKVSCPIIVLADNYTISVAEAIAMAIHLLPNGRIVGETTWGATGPLAVNEVFNSGQFQIGDMISVYTSSARFRYIDGNVYEGIGFSPDVKVPYNAQLLGKGVDQQLEKAIALLK